MLDKQDLLGVIEESICLLTVHDDWRAFIAREWSDDDKADTVRPRCKPRHFASHLDRGLVAIIADDKQFYGLVTRFDLLNHLRKKLTMKPRLSSTLLRA